MPSAVSFRYARALVDAVMAPAGGSPSDPRRIPSQLKEFAQLLEQSDELQTLFATPAVPLPKKRAVLAAIVAKMDMGPLAHNFLGVLLQNERMLLLGDMIEAFEQLLNERLGVVVAQIISASPLEDAEKQELDRALRARTGKQVQMSFSLDRSLIGGVLAQVGSTIYDGSVRGQLERLRSELAGQSSVS
jgi:F-type H+-transporting ATPase subunit delta